MPETATMEKTEKAAPTMTQLVCFMLGDEQYGAEILKLREIVAAPAITRVPRAPDFIAGVINLRGNVVPVIDLRTRFGMEKKALEKSARIVIVEFSGRRIGLIVDTVTQVKKLKTDQIEPTPPIAMSVATEYIKGVAHVDDKLLIILDVDKFLSKEEGKALMELEAAQS